MVSTAPSGATKTASRLAGSLSLAFFLLFLSSFTIHAVSGASEYSRQQVEHGQPAISAWQFLGTATFWFQSLQNWQSEFLSTAVLIVLAIYLREKGSPESKPVAAPHAQTGTD